MLILMYRLRIYLKMDVKLINQLKLVKFCIVSGQDYL